MRHDTINIPMELYFKKYDSRYLENIRGKVLLRKERSENLPQTIRDVSRAYRKAQAMQKQWSVQHIEPIWKTIKSLDKDQGVHIHVKPTHTCDATDGENWWLYDFKYEPSFDSYSYSFTWVAEPEKKLHLDLGIQFYNAHEKYDKHYGDRTGTLETLLLSILKEYVYSLYDYKWLNKNCYKEAAKIIKIDVHGDSYWFRIEHNDNNVPIWKCFIWQNQKIEHIYL
jgi:hypothetical protein